MRFSWISLLIAAAVSFVMFLLLSAVAGIPARMPGAAAAMAVGAVGNLAIQWMIKGKKDK